MRCKIEFELDNAAFHWKGYCNSREEKETLDLPEVGRVVCGVGGKIANGQTFGSIADANGNSVGFFNIIGRQP